MRESKTIILEILVVLCFAALLATIVEFVIPAQCGQPVHGSALLIIHG